LHLTLQIYSFSIKLNKEKPNTVKADLALYVVLLFLHFLNACF